MLVIAALGGRASAQFETSRFSSCVGDCQATGRVSIDDLLVAVNIVLGLAPLDACPSLGPAPVGISQLILAVNNALCNCAQCPPPPTLSATATATVVLPTPTPTPLVSIWAEDKDTIKSSTCPSDINSQLRQLLTPDTNTVQQQGDQIQIKDQEGDMVGGTIDASGTLQAGLTVNESQGACMVTIDQELTVNISQSPTTAKYVLTASSHGCPRNISCKVQITSQWTRTSSASASGLTVHAALRAALLASP